jgi:hypothetical protein
MPRVSLRRTYRHPPAPGAGDAARPMAADEGTGEASRCWVRVTMTDPLASAGDQVRMVQMSASLADRLARRGAVSTHHLGRQVTLAFIPEAAASAPAPRP